jgi:two-component system NtrC family sensor kinase
MQAEMPVPSSHSEKYLDKLLFFLFNLHRKFKKLHQIGQTAFSRRFILLKILISNTQSGYEINALSQMPSTQVLTDSTTHDSSTLFTRFLAVRETAQVIKKTVEDVGEAVSAIVCGVVFTTEETGLITAVSEGDKCSNSLDIINFRQFDEWLMTDLLDSLSLTDSERFFLSEPPHQIEIASPLIISGEKKGVLVVGFENLADYTVEKHKLIDLSAKLAATALQIAVLHETDLNASVTSALDEQRRFMEAILDALPVSIYAINRDYKIVAWNRHREVGLQGVPREQVIGQDVFDILTRQPREKLRQEFERAFCTGQIERIEQRATDDNGQTKHWLVSKVPMRNCLTDEVTHVITVGEDITARVEAGHAVARAEKLAAVGRLAAGVVHEINNPLATIAACSEALTVRVKEGVFGESPDVEDLRDYLELIHSESFRCKTITNGLLDFSRVRSGNRAPTDISEVVNSSARLLHHQKRREKIEIVVETEENLPLINVNQGQLQQAVISLATNGIDAMPNGGKLTLRAFQKGRQIIIEVADTGIGIEPENLSKIFEPFFTTKEVGQGTGLGLAVCYGIITEQGGSLSVRSTVGSGSTFAIFLPIKPKNSQV